MKVSEIKRLAQNNSIEELRKAEEAIINEESPEIEVNGSDEGDKLTNLSGAIWVLEKVELNGTEIKEEVRNFTNRVRESIN